MKWMWGTLAVTPFACIALVLLTGIARRAAWRWKRRRTPAMRAAAAAEDTAIAEARSALRDRRR